MILTSIIKSAMPEDVLKWYYYNFRFGWRGNYDSWQEARTNTSGYDAPSVIETVKANARKVQKGEAVYERDGAIFESINLDFPLLSALLHVASGNNNKLTVLDYGGSLGTTYYQNKNFLSHLDSLHWCIKEQTAFVDAGRDEFETSQLHFYYSVAECLKQHRPDILVFCSSIQYLEKPYDVLEEILSYNIPNLLIDRISFSDNGHDRLTVQKTSSFFYNASYPCWFFSRKKFIDIVGKKYKLKYNFPSGDSFYIGMKKKQYEGMFFELK